MRVRCAGARARAASTQPRDLAQRAPRPAVEDIGSGSGGVGTSSEASWSTSRSTRSGSGRSCTRYRHGTSRCSSSPATASLAAIIRCSIRRWDSVCARAQDRADVALLVERELGLLGFDHQRSAALAPALAARRRPPRAATAAARPRAPRPRSAPAKMRSTLLVVQALRRSGSASGRRRRSRPSRRRSSSSTVTAGALGAGHAASRRRSRARAGSIGSTAPGTYTLVARRRASRSTSEPSGTWARDVGDVHPHPRRAPRRASSAEIASSKSRALAGSIVNVASPRRSRRCRLARARPRSPAASRLALDRRRRSRARGRGRASAPRSRRAPRRGARAPARAARRRRAPGAVRTSTRSPARRPRGARAAGRRRRRSVAAPRACASCSPRLARREQRLGRQEAPAPLEHRHERAALGPPARAEPAAAVARPARARSPDFGGERLQRHVEPVRGVDDAAGRPALRASCRRPA